MELKKHAQEKQFQHFSHLSVPFQFRPIFGVFKNLN